MTRETLACPIPKMRDNCFMSAREIIDQIKHLPPEERVQVVHYVVENEAPRSVGKATVELATDDLPIIRATPGKITSSLVRELESLTP